MSASEFNGGQAFPLQATRDYFGQRGMTLRDYFAGQALAGELASSSTPQSAAATAEAAAAADLTIEEQIARNCYGMADAMLAERKKGDDTL